MRNYIILNNKKSDTISGLIIQELPAISKPAQRTQIETIDGRDGDIVTPLGYAAYDKTFTIGLYGNFDINEVIAYFATKGTVIFSNEPDKYYYYQIVDQIDYERLVRYRVATVTMHVQPFKYSATEGTITVDTSDIVSGEGSDIALDGTAEAPFNVLRHKGNATQKTLSGKNLLNVTPYRTGATYYNLSVGTQVVADTSANVDVSLLGNKITITCSATWNGAFFLAEVEEGKTYHIYAHQLGTECRTTRYTLDANHTIVRQLGNIARDDFVIDTDITVGTGEKYIALAIGCGSPASTLTLETPQVELGTTKTDYEEFCGGTPSPNPDYPQDISLLTGDSTITIDDGGENSQEYVIPFGDTYLAKIGDYVDEPVKVDGTWYIRRAIGKVAAADFSNSTNISGGGVRYYTPNEYGGKSSPQEVLTKSSHFIGCSHANRGAALNTAYVNGNMGVSMDTTMTLNQFKTWFANNNVDLYYVLATPTDEEITDQDLIDALDELYDQAHAYKGHTHITATAADGNAPAVLAVDVNEDNESTVTNAGNTTSRPILTIYGQGDIGLYINDVEVLDIALGDEGYITLDSVEMEAYKDTTANLKNRLVTGDYSKLALNAGANKIRFTGKVTKYEISKYSRWL